jgi:predicted dehydrogenase/type 1 glutamine amidotransferase
MLRALLSLAPGATPGGPGHALDESLPLPPRWQPFASYVRASHEIALTAAPLAGQMDHLDEFAALLLDAEQARLDARDAAALGAWVRRGGGLVVVDSACAGAREGAPLGDLLGLAPAPVSQTTELRVRVAGEHDLTRRLDPDWTVRDRIALLEAAPADAQVVLTASWRFSEVPAAYLRPYGAGWVFWTALGASDETLAHPAMRQVLFRALRYAAGWREEAPMGVAMIGYGAIGFEHATAMRETPGLDHLLVCDRSTARLEAARQAFPDLRTTTEIEEVAADPAIGAAIVCTPPNTHAAVAARLLRAGKHVVVEKPFCLTTAEADNLIALASERRLALTVYQNRRWDPDFLAIQQAIQRGAIGEVFHLETFIGGFGHPCNFWHSHEPVSGGVFYDWGSHYLDWVLTLLPGEVANVRASAHKLVWHDVTNADQATLTIRFVGGQEATFIHSDIAALLKPKWYILGTEGAIVGDWRHETVTTRAWSGDLVEERLAPSEALPLVTVAVRARDGLIHEQRLALPPAPRHPFHRNLADHLLAGEPLAVNPISSRRNIAVMEAAAYSAAHDAAVVPIANEHD